MLRRGAPGGESSAPAPLMTKGHILAEIRRTAAANGGRPLGRERFFVDTGFKEADWYLKHWVRSSEAFAKPGCSRIVSASSSLESPSLQSVSRMPLSGVRRRRVLRDGLGCDALENSLTCRLP